MIATHPDALLIQESLKTGSTVFKRMNSVLDIAEPILGVDRGKGERAYVRRQGDGWLFITCDHTDTLYFPLRCRLRGRPRYRWTEPVNGIRQGFLTPQAREFAISSVNTAPPSVSALGGF